MALYQRLKRQVLSQVHLVRVALALALVAGLVAMWLVVVRPLGPSVSFVWRVWHTSLPASSGRTNFLIMGREGPGSSRAGTDLTDTMILALVAADGDTVMLSIPRDLWVSSLRAKINTAYYYGEQRQPGGGGIILAKAAVEEVIGQPVHYAVVIDFAGFEQIIDLIGGVDINVDRSFVDNKFPVPGRENDDCGKDVQHRCRYQTVQFAAGWQHMDGATALKFVRSRQAEGEEGTDFARSRRQEKLLLALKSKLLSRSVLMHPRLGLNLYHQVSQGVVTDVTSQMYLALARLGVKVVRRPLRPVALTEPDWVYHPPVSAKEDYQWVLLPAEGLRSHVENLLARPVQK